MRNPAIWTYSQEKFPASILLGRRIYNYDSRPLGSLEDLLIKDGVVTALIISRDAGIRDRHIAAPYQPLDFGTDGILYDIAVEKLGSLPDYPYEAIKEDKPQDGPFGPFYTPPGVVETEEEIMVGQ